MNLMAYRNLQDATEICINVILDIAYIVFFSNKMALKLDLFPSSGRTGSLQRVDGNTPNFRNILFKETKKDMQCSKE
jgi:hypothetical protein